LAGLLAYPGCRCLPSSQMTKSGFRSSTTRIANCNWDLQLRVQLRFCTGFPFHHVPETGTLEPKFEGKDKEKDFTNARIVHWFFVFVEKDNEEVGSWKQEAERRRKTDVRSKKHEVRRLLTGNRNIILLSELSGYHCIYVVIVIVEDFKDINVQFCIS